MVRRRRITGDAFTRISLAVAIRTAEFTITFVLRIRTGAALNVAAALGVPRAGGGGVDADRRGRGVAKYWSTDACAFLTGIVEGAGIGV